MAAVVMGGGSDLVEDDNYDTVPSQFHRLHLADVYIYSKLGGSLLAVKLVAQWLRSRPGRCDQGFDSRASS